jgi:hypothetical protein
MPTHVYANGEEIAAKSADGSSKFAAPDVCHTPPATAAPTPLKPFPPGTPVAYANTCHARDISNGSRSVFIVGKEIALENYSYFNRSEGDSLATKKLAKGLVSGAVDGKGYFACWSPNVFVEGRAVARNDDLVSHNHSNPSNTALFPYISRGRFGGHECRKEEKRIQKACSKGPKPRRPSNPNRSANSNRRPDNHWTRDFCTGLQFPANAAKADIRSDLNELLDTAAEQFSNLSEGFWSHLGSAAASGLGKLAVRSGVRIGTGAVVGFIGSPVGSAIAAGIGTAVSVGDTVITVVSGLWNLPETWAAANGAADLFNEAKGLLEGLDQILDEQGQLKLTDDELADAVGEWQDLVAKLNPCLRARKCSLVPFRNKGVPGNNGPKNNVEPANQGGCCPGQQAHHPIPQAVMKGVECRDDKDGRAYKDAEAPTVCVEGNRENRGSHKRVHDKFDGQLRELNKDEKIGADGTMSMNDAVKAAAASHQDAFPLSRCRPGCIIAQLREYYDRLCPNARVNAVLQDGTPAHTPINPNGGFD